MPTRSDLRPWTLERLVALALGVLWLTLPATTGAAMGDALEPSSTAVQAVVGTLAWLGWGAGLVALLAPRTITLTLVRFVIPAAMPTATWAALAADPVTALGVVGATTAAVATVLVLAPHTGSRFVNGSAYGHERRFPLRAPAAVVLGPIEVLWAAVVAGVVAGPVLLAAEQWVAGSSPRFSVAPWCGSACVAPTAWPGVGSCSFPPGSSYTTPWPSPTRCSSRSRTSIESRWPTPRPRRRT